MNSDTGEIISLKDISTKMMKSGKWIEIPDEHLPHLEKLNRKERRKYLREHGQFKKGKWGWI